jgi:F-type H+-transporting ATPase subunit delta
MTEGSISRRYARALLDLGRDNANIDALGADLARFLENARGQLLETLSNPVYTRAERRAVLDAVLVRIPLSPLAQNFLRLLLDKERMAALEDIARAYGELADAAAGRVRALVTTASPMSPALQAEVAAALSGSTGQTVVIEARVDSSLLGGITARVGSRFIDASLKGRLERLQLALLTPSAAQA